MTAVPGRGDVHKISTKISTGKLMARTLVENANWFHAMALSRLLPHYSTNHLRALLQTDTEASVAQLATASVSQQGGAW